MKQLFVLAFALVLLAGCQETPKGYIINGTITDKQDGMVYLKSFRNKMFFDYDSVRIIDGKFTFKGELDQPLLFGIATDEMRSPIQFFLENRIMDISMTARGRDFTVLHSPANDLFLSLAEQIHEVGYDITTLISEYSDSNVAAFYLYRYFTYQLSLSDLKATRAKISPMLNSSPYVQDLDGIIRQLENVQIGKVAPDFTLPDTEGNPVSLKDFRGKYVLIDFWAAWCPPCRQENPNIVKTYHEFKDKNFTILGVSLDYSKENWLKGIADDGLVWTHVSDLQYWDSEIPALYGVRGIPANMLLNPEGVIIAKDIMGEELPATLSRYMN